MTFDPKAAPLPIVLGVICSEGKFLVARRKPESHLGGTWEFPGGKLRPGESLENALHREVEEEMGVRFHGVVLLHVEEHSYSDRTVLLHFFLCLDPKGTAEGKEEQEIRWVTLEELKALETPPANQRFLRILQDQFGE